MAAVRVAVCVIATALGCRSAPPAAPEPVAPRPASAPVASGVLAEMLRLDLAADRAFPWSAARHLEWLDFQGTPPAGGPLGAMTAYTLYYAWKCRGERFEFHVIAGFRPGASWVTRVILNDPDQRRSALAHEQTHFDLTEVHARIMRRRFAELGAPCRKADAELGTLARRLIQDEKTEQRRYDRETDNGRLDGPQAAWTDTVTRRLAPAPH